MSYKNLEQYDSYCNFLEAALCDLGYKDISREGREVHFKSRQGSSYVMSEQEMYFLMGETVAQIGIYCNAAEKVLEQENGSM